MTAPKIVVIGGGIAGLSVAARLAEMAVDVTVLERELQPGYHSSGRSAAVYIEPYINETVCEITRAGREAHLSMGAKPVENLMIADADNASLVDGYLQHWRALCPEHVEVDPRQALESVPILKRDAVARAVVDPTCLSLDAHAMLDGYRRRLLAAHGKLVCNADVIAIERSNGWRVGTTRQMFDADVVVNAAGAWADVIAEIAGVEALGIQPLRRTGVLVDVQQPVAHWPLVHRVEDDLYFKPEAGLLMISPVDEHPSPPCDAQPEELDVAIAIDRFESATQETNVQPKQTWAGLRTFLPGSIPAVGFDANVEGFFWIVGQGGFGMQTAPELSRIAGELLMGRTDRWQNVLAPGGH